MFYQRAGELSLNPPRFYLIVEFRNFGERVGGDQPDLAGAGIGDAHQVQVGLDIAGRHGAQFLAAERNPFLRSSLRLGKATYASGECGAIHHRFELGGDLFSFGLATRSVHLQVLSGDAVVARLSGLQETKDGARGSGAIQRIDRWVGRGRSGRRSGGQGLAEHGLNGRREKRSQGKNEDENRFNKRDHGILLHGRARSQRRAASGK